MTKNSKSTDTKEPVHTLPGTPTAQERVAERSAACCTSPDLDEWDAALVRFLVSQGFHIKRIAALFDISQDAIKAIANDKVLVGNKLIHSVYELTKAD